MFVITDGEAVSTLVLNRFIVNLFVSEEVFV